MSAPTEQDNQEAQGIVDSCYYTDDDVTGGYDRGALIRTIAAALQAERERTRAETRAETWKDAIAALMQAEKEDARLAAAQLPQASDTARKEWLSRLTDPDDDEYEPLPQGKDK